ncbi:peptidoglycan editing factor PgeF [Thalassotalea ponticola]|uniref:peptidoglycan editing factor PgeF n=1 Tax=Thalassotalea ponticola TaxID=1523392 RepID=UPI0025B56816|nr:peptidoglycan editing factor PgeF [Thalassotalea ponticola]MDN3653954.1 peptidoglycan editing factor PgeF [Thalassotalea ponticola]
MIKPSWPVSHLCHAVSTTRQGGYSAAPFASLNMGAHVGDCADRVDRNRRVLCQHVNNKPVQWLEQVHGNCVVKIDNVTPDPIVADAAYSQNRNVALAILTADCLPILLIDKHGSEIAAIHGGWRPLATGIVKNTLEYFSCSPSDIYAWLGPCIGPQHFEVGVDVVSAFESVVTDSQRFFIAKSITDKTPLGPAKFLANLAAIARQQLRDLGVRHIYDDNHCTVTNADQFFSYRRDKQTGRMASCIAIADE